MRTKNWLAGLVVTLLLAACGGGSDVCYYGPSSTKCNEEAAVTATGLTIQLSTTSIDNSGAQTVVATATATTTGGQTVTGAPVTFSVDGGAVFTPSATETDDKGVVTADIGIGADKSNRTVTVVATSGSLTATTVFTVKGAKLTGTASPAVVEPSAAGTVGFLLQDASGNAIPGQPISIVAGVLAPVEAVTGENGTYIYQFTAPSSPTTLTVEATAGGAALTVIVPVQAGSTVPPATQTPTSATVAVDPSVVAPNVDATSKNSAVVRALFIDANNRPIANMRVRFKVNGYGSFSTGDELVYSDSNGVAISSFVPGSRTSPKDGVTITACYEKTDFTTCGANQTTKTLTVAADPLSITIGTDNKLSEGEQKLTYKQRFIVTTVDIAGRPKANVDITPSLDLPYFLKGQYTRSDGEWVSVCTDASVCPIVLTGPIGCPNEDLARTGFYQQAQDTNQNGQIDPRKSDVSVYMENGVTKTNELGQVVLVIEYPKNVGSWIQYTILVSAGVAGTEGRASWVDVLGVPVDDVKAEGVPPFVRSPYGVVTTTAVPSINFPPPAVPRGPVAPCANAD